MEHDFDPVSKVCRRCGAPTYRVRSGEAPLHWDAQIRFAEGFAIQRRADEFRRQVIEPMLELFGL